MKTAIPLIMRTDGKRYPLFQLTTEEREFLIDAVHQLRHDRGLTIKGIQQYLADHGVPRASGTIQGYLAQPCERCPARPLLGPLERAIA
jgi:hypothetical protein